MNTPTPIILLVVTGNNLPLGTSWYPPGGLTVTLKVHSGTVTLVAER